MRHRTIIQPFALALVLAAAIAAPSPLPAGEPAGGCQGAAAPETGARSSMASSQAALPPLGPTSCTGGFAGPYPCDKVDILSFMPSASFGAGAFLISDMWGWTDPVTDREYVLAGHPGGTAFIDITDPTAPVWVGTLPTQASSSFTLRDIKTLGDFAIVVGDVAGHGLQIFDLNELRGVTSPPAQFSPTVLYTQFGRAHNVAVDEESGFIYALSTNTCGGGMHMVDATDPLSPDFAGCVDDDGFTHDAQCLVYRGPDARFQGRQICFASSEDSLNIYDVTDKSAWVNLAEFPYPCRSYVHQGWITEDHRFFVLDDEGDEDDPNSHTKTYFFDIQDLTSPLLHHVYTSPTATSIDHNLFVHEAYAYEANYSSGLRILDLAELHQGVVPEAAYLDTDPNGDVQSFTGAFSAHPFYASGTVAFTVSDKGLFLVRPDLPADFVLETDSEEIEICSPGTGTARATVRARLGFTGNVTLSAQDLDTRASALFDVNPVSPTGSATLSLDVPAPEVFTDPFVLRARRGGDTRERQMTLRVADAPPGPASPTSPADGEEGVDVRTAFSWTGDPLSARTRLELATDAAFSQIVLDVTVAGTSYQVERPLLAGTTYHWRLTEENPCGAAPVSSTSSFVTGSSPPILLVDDDDDCPDVRGDVTAALTALGRDFAVWDTGWADEDPGAGTLSSYGAVIWLTGREYWTAGPGAAGEAALGPWLDQSACFLVSSQNYLNDQGFTAFMQSHLGLVSATKNVNYSTVTGKLPHFGGLGPFALSPPYPRFTDRLGGGIGTGIAFDSPLGVAGTLNDTGVFRAGYLGFGLEGLPAPTDRRDVLGAFLAACDALPALDGDGDGVANGLDCSPSGGALWRPPGPARDLRFSGTQTQRLEWSPPLDPGALVPLYDVLRSSSDPSFAAPACLEVGGTNTSATAPDDPAPDEAYIYAVRVRNGCGETLGSGSDGSPREAPACVSTCGDGVIDGFDLCDGADVGMESCASQGYDGGILGCNASCDAFDLSGCTTVCGDGIRRGLEICDGPDTGAETCTSQGFDGGTLGCNGTCDGFDLSGCTTVCGDGVRRGFEECDGADLDGETCTSRGFDGGTLACDSSCGFDLSGCTTVCGDGVRRGFETCDGSDTGTENCISQGFDGGTLGCNATCDGFVTSACTTCGDNVREGSEVCDGTDLAGETCHSQGFSIGGTLRCKNNCNGFDTTGCEPL